ncbi:MAG: zinc-finger domain-containing protein [Variibacter sp.]|nr:zinc-finger domain-containing protein [Variibacter sp.]
MADHAVPHFHNDPGVPVIEIGAKEFMCVGATPPFDHPHIFCDMGDENEIICPYCSTLYRYDPSLRPHEARPPECALREPAGVMSPTGA